MTDPTSRALRLLDLLQRRRWWNAPELADRLGVTPRTVRRDIERLRALGYMVDSSPGAEGGYALAQGTGMPPLLLDDDEALALAVGLRTVAVSGRGPEASARTMAKIEALLPAHLRRRATALTAHVVGIGLGPGADAQLLGELALACRASERVRFGYQRADGESTTRHAEPHTLVTRSGRWYLLCFDLDRDEWRTFRLDRMSEASRTGVRFKPRTVTDEEVEAFFRRPTPEPSQRAEVVLEVALTQFQNHFGGWAHGAEACTVDGREATRWPLSGSRAEDILGALYWIPPGWAWSLTCSDEVADHIAAWRHRLDAVPVTRLSAGGGTVVAP